MTRVSLVLVGILAASVGLAHAGDPQPSLLGKWHNSLCSEMEIKSTDAATGLLTGEYRTGVGQPKPTDAYRLTGFLNGDVVGFSVNWGKPTNAGGKAVESVTSWAGQHTVIDGVETIKTYWQLAFNVADADEMGKLWSGLMAGGDTFKKGAAPAGCTPKP